MKTKAMLKALSIVLSISLIGGLLPDKVANAATLSDAMKPSISANKILTQEETSQIESEINTLKNFYIDRSIIKSVNVTAKGNEYTLNYNNIDEKVIIESSDNESTTLVVSDGEKSNVVSLKKDGSIILDGYKVEISQVDQVDQIDTNIDVAPMGTIYKSVKSLSPYAGLTSSDYNQYLNSGKQNISLGKRLDSVTNATLSLLIGATYGFMGILVSLTYVAEAVYSVLKNVDPATQYLGCLYTTWTAGSDDYQYYSKFYANTACTGTYSLQVSYEHFTVY